MKKQLLKKRFAGILLGVAIPFMMAVLISMKAASIEHEGCTSWAAIGDALEPQIRGNKVILHKNRDMSDTHTMDIREIDNGAYKYLAIAGHNKDSSNTTDDTLLVWAGFNETGLAAASNYVGGINLFGTRGGASFCREILENCNSVDSAYAYISANKSKFYSGNLIFLADPHKIAVVEAKVWLFGAVKISSKSDSIVDGSVENPNILYRSNHYINLTNYIPIPASDDTIARYNRLTSLMDNPAGSLYGLLDVQQSRAVSRLENNSGSDAFCKTSTLARITIEIDRLNPLASIIWYGPGYDESRKDGDHCTDDVGALQAYTFSEK
jgi:hypothetical protein